MTGNVRDNFYPHIRFLPTYPQRASVDFIRFLPAVTSAHSQIRTSTYYPEPAKYTFPVSGPWQLCDTQLTTTTCFISQLEI